MTTTLATLTALYIFSLLVAEFFVSIRYPRVLGYIIGGILVGLPFVKAGLTQESIASVAFLSQLGILFLFLLIGLEVDLTKFKKSSKEAVQVGGFGFLLPLIISLGAMLLAGYSFFVSFIVAVALSVTAEATTAQLLLELKALKTRVGNILLGAGLIDDLFGIIMVTVILAVQNGDNLLLFPLKFVGFAVVVWGAFKLTAVVIHHIQREESAISNFSFLIALALLIAISAEMLGFGELIGAFTAGLIVNIFNRHEHTAKCPKICHRKAYVEIQKQNVEDLKVMTLSFIIPFFFIYTGIQFDFTHVIDNLPLILGITAIALLGKFGGVYLAKKFNRISWPEFSVIGWGMNSRGAVGFVLAQIAYDAKLIDSGLYTAIISVALITTLAFPFFVKREFKRHPELLKEV